MFLFVEGDKTVSHIEIGLISQSHVEFIAPISFSEAIRCMASKCKEPQNVVIFTNFFTIACSKLKPYEIRGLERIALGDNAVELHYGQARKTRFIVAVDGEALSRISTIEAIVMNMLQDPISFGIGNYREGNTLIVGEAPGAKCLGYNTPFVGSGSGMWLLKQLEDFQIDEDNYYWINAKDNFGVEADKTFLSTLRPRKIIVLGHEANRWAKSLIDSFTVIHVPHPQYWSRFKSREPYPLFRYVK